VPFTAVRYRKQMVLGGVGLCTHSVGVVAGGAALRRVAGLKVMYSAIVHSWLNMARLVAPRDFFVISPINVTIMEEASLPWRRSGLVSQRGVWPIRRDG